MDVLFAAVTLISMTMAMWFFKIAKNAGESSERVNHLEAELERTKKVLRILGSELPNPRDALDELSNPIRRDDRSVSEDERNE